MLHESTRVLDLLNLLLHYLVLEAIYVKITLTCLKASYTDDFHTAILCINFPIGPPNSAATSTTIKYWWHNRLTHRETLPFSAMTKK